MRSRREPAVFWPCEESAFAFRRVAVFRVGCVPGRFGLLYAAAGVIEFRSENVSTTSRATLDHAAVVFVERACLAARPLSGACLYDVIPNRPHLGRVRNLLLPCLAVALGDGISIFTKPQQLRLFIRHERHTLKP